RSQASESRRAVPGRDHPHSRERSGCFLEAHRTARERIRRMSLAPRPGVREPEQLRGLSRAEPLSTRDLIRALLVNLGEDPDRQGLLRTPERVESSLAELTQGRAQTVESVVGDGVFEEDCSEMVLV